MAQKVFTETSPVGVLVSRLDHPVTISYNDDTIIVSPRGTTLLLERNKLGALPSGVAFQARAN